ncbi:MAG: thioredoxin fold domain-containing protein [Candidatus Cloacimonadota bacterium]|nr:thioredoxin fold domain-containing protein [Candidatus Cloacimonadota bacterium]
MQKISFIIVILFLLSTILLAQDSLQWTDSFPEAIEKAKNENRVIMIDFSSDRCGWCKKLHETTFQDSNVIELLKDNFVPIEINTSIEKNRDFANHYNVTGLPTIIFVNPVHSPPIKSGIGSGTAGTGEIDRIIGYLPAEQFIKKASFILNNKNYFSNLLKNAELHPDSIDIHKQLAEVYKRRGNYDRAEEIYNSILKRIEKANPSDTLIMEIPEIQAEIAMLYYKRYQYTESLERLTQIETEYPDYSDLDMILFNHALCLYRLKNFLEAKGALEKILYDFPESSLRKDAVEFINYINSTVEQEKIKKN